jgi:hypothetical protein
VRHTQHQELHLSDGQIPEYASAGPAGGIPLIFNTGSPGSRELFQPLVEAAARSGLRTGRSALAEVDVAPLPFNGAIEIEAVVEVRTSGIGQVAG